MSEVVVLLHGLARTHRSLRRLENALQRAGHHTWAGTYPSRARGIGALAAETAARIRAEAPAERYSAVTHSLGGILVRHMAELLPWRRVVMIAPPNAGSRVGRVFREHPLYRWFYGPAGLDVTEAEAWPDPPGELCVIAGSRGLALSNPTSWVTHAARLFPPEEPSDGTVAVSETRHPRMSAFVEVDASHTLIMNHPRVIASTLGFLARGVDGVWTPDRQPTPHAAPDV